MEIKYVRGMWGMEEGGLEANLKKISDGDFDMVEMGAPGKPEARAELKDLLEKHHLGYVGQQWSGGNSVEEHLESLEQQYRNNVDMGAILVNSHSGKDIFSLEDNLKVVRRAFELEQEVGVRLVHEIHRGRMTFCSNSTMELMDAEKDISFTADFSHWCCVHESLLSDQQDRVERAMQNTFHIHARVGDFEGPQVTHPFAPENKKALDAHVAWWDRIVELRRKDGTELLTICPEFGPKPYMPTVPFTNQPLVDLWEVNYSMKEFLKDRYRA
jgi:sugar phosphate isomerase/epimerase